MARRLAVSAKGTGTTLREQIPANRASQSVIFGFSAGNSKIVRMLAHFLRPEGTGEAEIRRSAADLCSILSVENRAGAPSHLLWES